jgi:hypothetical protein
LAPLARRLCDFVLSARSLVRKCSSS